MIDLDPDNLRWCHICEGELLPHPLYKASGAMYCPADGDFFIQRLRGEAPTVIFRKVEGAPPKTPTISPTTLRTTLGSQAGKGRNPGFIIRCNETGIVYANLKVAGRALGIHPSGLSMHLNGKRKTAGGYTFTILDKME